MKKYIILTIISLVAAHYASAQQDPMFSQYWVNPQILSPTFAGADGRTLVNATSRLQWINVKGAPRTHSIAIGGKVSESLGLGLSYVYDEVGISRTSTLNADFAYHLKLGNDWKLITGIRLIGLINNINFSDINTTTPSDPMFMQNLSSGVKPNAGFGFLLTKNKFYIGYSEPRLVNYDFGSSKSQINTHIISHKFAYAGVNINVTDNYKIRPSVLFKSVQNAPIQFDFNVANEFNNKLVLGISGRTGEGIGAMLGLINYHKLDIYYCYDYPLTAIQLLSKQTHQITVSLNLSKKLQRINSPRYFN